MAASSPDTSIYSPTSPVGTAAEETGSVFNVLAENTLVYKKSLAVYQTHVASRLERHAVNEQSLHVN